nr:hypothetical protein [uncultured Methanobacterium sp.]
MDTLINAITIIVTFTVFLFSLMIFLNMLKYKEAALSLIFNKLDESILIFKILAISILIFAIGRLLDLLNINSASSLVDDAATLLNLTTIVLLIFAFYKLFNIMKIKNHPV